METKLETIVNEISERTVIQTLSRHIKFLKDRMDILGNLPNQENILSVDECFTFFQY